MTFSAFVRVWCWHSLRLFFVSPTSCAAAGLIVSTTSKAKYIETKFSPLSYLLLTPIFFASVGLKVELPKMDAKILLFALLLIVVAILAKIG